MKAIPTRYAGYHFRSRLEARWCIMFDALGMVWEYEPEGFELSDGSRYLPDFRARYPSGEVMWFEVKGDVSEVTKAEWEKMAAFGKNERLILLDGLPEMRPYFDPAGLRPYLDDYARGKEVWRDNYNYVDAGVDPLDLPQSIPLCVGDCFPFKVAAQCWFPAGDYCITGKYGRGSGILVNSGPLLGMQRAVNAARSARFEHGESGPT